MGYFRAALLYYYMANKNFSFKNGLRVKKSKVDIACKQKIRIYHKKYIAVSIKKHF